MKKKYVIGVDGGNTKTQYALYDLEGRFINLVTAGTASHERLGGYEGMAKELDLRINQLLGEGKVKKEDVVFSVFGLAGADVKIQYAEIGKRLRNMGFESFKVCNDAYLGIKAGSEKGYGICSNNGTGTTCTGIDKSGAMLQIGGCGGITGDDAGGGFLARRAIRLVYESIYKCGKPTIMKDRLFDLLEVPEDDMLLDIVYGRIHAGTIDWKALSKMVFQAANQGDEEALALLKYIGKETSKSVVGMYRKLDFPGDEELEIIMMGSLYVKGENPTTVDTFKEEVRGGISGKIRFRILTEAPVLGAVKWALEGAGKRGPDLSCEMSRVKL